VNNEEVGIDLTQLSIAHQWTPAECRHLAFGRFFLSTLTLLGGLLSIGGAIWGSMGEMPNWAAKLLRAALGVFGVFCFFVSLAVLKSGTTGDDGGPAPPAH
jgi:hypothetical protein